MDGRMASDFRYWAEAFVFDEFLRWTDFVAELHGHNEAFSDIQGQGDGPHNMPAQMGPAIGESNEGTEVDLRRIDFQIQLSDMTQLEYEGLISFVYASRFGGRFAWE